MRSALTRHCVRRDVDLSQAIPGCAMEDLVDSAACLTELARRAYCRMVNRSSNVNAACDLVDDSLYNGSCVWPPL